MQDSLKIIGAHGNRRSHDFYPTPPECVWALLNAIVIPMRARIWDPACGDGAIIRELGNLGYADCFGTDIQTGTDFLTERIGGVDWIITNPPFCLAEQFIRRAHEYGIPFAYLLKSQYWNSSKRRNLFEEIRPKYVMPLTWRPDFTGQGASIMDVMWCVWDQTKISGTLYQPLEKPKKEEWRT